MECDFFFRKWAKIENSGPISFFSFLVFMDHWIQKNLVQIEIPVSINFIIDDIYIDSHYTP